MRFTFIYIKFCKLVDLYFIAVTTMSFQLPVLKELKQIFNLNSILDLDYYKHFLFQLLLDIDI